jgi:hypothetical protein
MSALGTINHNTKYSFVAAVSDVWGTNSEAGEVIEITDVADVSRYLVVTEDTRGYPFSWEEGDWYEFASVYGCNPKRPLYDSSTRRRDRLETKHAIPTTAFDVDPDVCPNCGGELRLDNALILSERVREIISKLPPEFMLIATPESRITHHGNKADALESTAVTSATPSSPPRVVCSDCGTAVEGYYKEQ